MNFDFPSEFEHEVKPGAPLLAGVARSGDFDFLIAITKCRPQKFTEDR
jgi:hypothetical protein